MCVFSKKAQLVVIIFVCMLVSFFFASGDLLAQDKKPVKIGCILPMTGVAGLYGEQASSGALVAEKKINDAGGILNGRPVKVILGDDQANPIEGVNVAKKIMAREGTKVLSGGVNSSVTLAQIEVIKEAGALLLVTTSKAPAIRKSGYPGIFALNSTNDMDGAVFHKFIAEELKPKTVGVLTENTDYGRAEIDALKKAWEPKGIKVHWEMFQLGELDFTVLLNKFKALNPDLMYYTIAAPTANGAVLKQAYEVGLRVPKAIAPGNLNRDVIRLGGAGSEGLFCADIYITELENKLNPQFVEDYKKMWNRPPEKMELLGYETIYLLSKSIDKAGSDTDIKKISNALRNTKWETPRGPLTFNEIGQATGTTFVQIVKDGKIAAYK